MGSGRACGLCWALLVLLLLLVATAAYRLMGGAQTEVASDARAEIALSVTDRDLVLAEMRAFLASVQGITSAIADDDLVTVAGQARAVGLAAMGQVPMSLMQALPMEFKTMGRATHAGFDQLALDAEQLGDRDHTLRQMGEILSTCVACHATYRLTVAKDGGS